MFEGAIAWLPTPWVLFVTTKKRYMAFFSMFLQLPIHHRSWCSHLHSTCTLLQVI